KSFPSGSFLAGLEAPDRSQLVREGRPMSLPAGATLLFEGDLSDRVVVVLAGTLRVFSTAANGREILVTVAGPGEILGEMSALDGQPHSASVNTVDPAEVVLVPAEEFRSVLRSNAGIATAVALRSRGSSVAWCVSASTSRRSTSPRGWRRAWSIWPSGSEPGAGRSSCPFRNASSPDRAALRERPSRRRSARSARAGGCARAVDRSPSSTTTHCGLAAPELATGVGEKYPRGRVVIPRSSDLGSLPSCHRGGHTARRKEGGTAMQAQAVHQRKASVPWLPASIAALVLAGIVLTAQLAIDRVGTTAPAITIAPGTATKAHRQADAQKAGTVEAG